ncbi:hypothetical protein R3P38DRAFT_3178751 [Favolaschia claudopus]|uniref:Uncharacterized protein n=1 Tax=Favolaschia claudopus TaxID=2862362 RepID=A0AAW0CVJ8_9AGAR
MAHTDNDDNNDETRVAQWCTIGIAHTLITIASVIGSVHAPDTVHLHISFEPEWQLEYVHTSQ